MTDNDLMAIWLIGIFTLCLAMIAFAWWSSR